MGPSDSRRADSWEPLTSSQFEIELPLDAHVDASWEEGGGYCVVWDENRDGRLDSFSSEPVNCTSDVALDSIVRIDVQR